MHTCGGCESRWGGLSAAHCATCHQTFGSVRWFDKHRFNGKCRAPQDLGLQMSARGNGVWSMPYEPAA